MNLLDQLYQEETWTDREGVTRQIADMEPRYCSNVIAFLNARVNEIAAADSRAVRSIRMPSVDTVAYDAVAGSMFDEEHAKLADPLTWLSSLPLLRALNAKAAGGES